MSKHLPARALSLATCLAAAALILATATGAHAAGGRTVLSLDGTWRIAQGTMDAPAEKYTRTVPVPGLVDLATPAYKEVGVASKLRQAFWYRRTFDLRGPRRAVAMLKIDKAQFGTKVWVNGREVGLHWGCFTPGYFDVAPALKWGGQNELVVRVGAYRDAVPKWVPVNTDYEESKWIPGIYDDVSLILADDPWAKSIQVAPKIRQGVALVQVELQNRSSAPKTATVRLAVREWKSGKAAGAPVTRKATVAPGATATILADVKLDHEHLWSPEDPFLYVMRCEVRSGGAPTGGALTDSVDTRFGMREFHYDPINGRAYLNGEPYFLRGTDFCMFRFFEDPIRGRLPWNHAWVRRLLELPKRKLHWNSARVCIAPFPEFWYRIADEEGWLLQDEFPIWGFHNEWSQAELKKEFAEWVRERWNHPSIVVWDACNETLTPRTGELIAATRGLDLSNRPWDDGYSPRARPTDPMEIHPYLFIGQTTKWNPSALGSVFDRAIRLLSPPFVINEYDAMWLQRNGQPATAYRGFYDAMLGPKATPEQRRKLLAYTGAALTEYWRARREAAGVQWFCYLTYSRPGGVTSDNFIDLRHLVLEPHFVDYMSNAFSPLAVMIDDCQPFEVMGSRQKYLIIITNDLAEPQSGKVRLTMAPRDGSGHGVVAEASAPFSVGRWGQTTATLTIPMTARPGKYMLTATLEPKGGAHVLSRRKVDILTPEQARERISLGKGKPVTASSEVTDARGNCPARFVNDGLLSTRWSSEFSDPQWISIDLGKPEEIGRVVLRWEAAYGKAYSIQVSDDGKTWRTVYSTDNGHGGQEVIKFPPTTARYVRMYGTKRGNDAWGYSLWEFQIFGK